MTHSRRPVLASLLAIGILLSAALLGFGGGGIFDQLRVVTINSVFGNWDSGVPYWARGIAVPAGVLGCIALGAKYTNLTQGRRPWCTTSALVLAGLAAGAWISVGMWAPADAVGVAVDPTFHQDEAWGVGAWVLYTAQWWLPLLLTACALASIGGSLSAHARARARARRD